MRSLKQRSALMPSRQATGSTSVEELLRAIARITRDEGLSAIIVEQHPQAILAISHRAVVLDHGNVVHRGAAAPLLEQPELLDRLLGVSRAHP